MISRDALIDHIARKIGFLDNRLRHVLTDGERSAVRNALSGLQDEARAGLIGCDDHTAVDGTAGGAA